jgi:PAS domain S-box-containing protein
MPITPEAASSGAAAALRQRVVVNDVLHHPNWVDYRELARVGDFSACWSEPVIGAHGQLLGTFTAYYRTPARPHEEYLGLVTQGARLTALIIEHLRNAQELSSSLDTFRGIFDSISEALLIQAADHRFLYANASAEQLFGFPYAALVGQTHEFLLPPGLCDLPAIDEQIASALAGQPQIFETLARSADERIFPIEVRLHTADYFGRPVLVASAVDISERKNAALRLEIEHDLAQSLTGDADRQQIVIGLLQSALRFPEFKAGAIYLRQADGSYSCLPMKDCRSNSLTRPSCLRQPAASPAWPSGAGDLHPGGRDSALPPGLPDRPAAVHGDDLRSLLQLPIVVDGKPVACLLLGSRLTSRIAPATLHSLAVLGRYFGQTLQRLDSLEESSRLQHNLSGIFDTLTDFIFVLDMECTILHYNRAVAETLGYGREALKGKPILAVHPQNLRDIAEQRMADLIAGRSLSWPLPILCANGQQLQVETRVASGYWDGKPALIGVSQDISERLHAEERQRLAASVFDNAHEGIMITDQSGRIIEVNSTFTELTGYTREEAVGSTPDLLKSGHHDAAFYLEMWAKIRVDGYWRGEIWNRKKTGEIFVEQLTISTVRNRDGEISHYVAIFSDITLIKQHQQRLEHLAHFDALTQLPNRMLLSDRLQLAKAQSERAAANSWRSAISISTTSSRSTTNTATRSATTC